MSSIQVLEGYLIAGIIKKTMKEICFLTLAVLFFSTCYTQTASETIYSKYYSDIDMFQMIGINELLPSEVKYPYIQIDSTGPNQKNISFYYDKDTFYKRVYERRHSVWLSMHAVKDDSEGATFYYYEYFSRSKIIFLEYRDNPKEGGSLVSLRILKDGQETVYDFDEGEIQMQPTDDVQMFALEKSFRIESSEYQIQNGVLKIRTSYEFRDKEIEGGTLRKCYQINSLSFFWWSFIGYKLDEVECS